MVFRKMLSVSISSPPFRRGTMTRLAVESRVSRRRATTASRGPRMAWIIGIDEAGYGPNLGPFVTSSAAFRVPDGDGTVNLWQLLPTVVRRAVDPMDGRILIDDSKAVYSTARGLLGLEHGVLATLWRASTKCATLQH